MNELTEKEQRILELKNESVLVCVYGSSGPYFWILPLAALISFLLLAWLISKGRLANSPIVTWAVALVPCYVGALAMIDGLARYFRVIEQSGTEPDPAAVCGAIAFAIDWLSYGMKLAIPSVAILTVASLWRRSPALTGLALSPRPRGEGGGEGQ
jgi:heme exporter protein D